MEPAITSTPMRDKYEYIRLDVADNGFILCWDECIPNIKNDYTYYENHKEVFPFTEMDKGIKKMISLQMENIAHKMSMEKDAARKKAYEEAMGAYEAYKS